MIYTTVDCDCQGSDEFSHTKKEWDRSTFCSRSLVAEKQEQYQLPILESRSNQVSVIVRDTGLLSSSPSFTVKLRTRGRLLAEALTVLNVTERKRVW